MSNLDLLLSVVLGIVLAAATGFRVFLPMLIASGAAFTGHLPLDQSFAWLGTPFALTMLGVAALVEVVAYYIPGIDNLLDALATPAAFVAGTVLSAAVMTDLPPMTKWIAAIIAGGGAAADAGHHGHAEGEIDPPDRRDRQPGHRDRGTGRRATDPVSGSGSTVRRVCAGRPAAVAGDPPAPAAPSRSRPPTNAQK